MCVDCDGAKRVYSNFLKFNCSMSIIELVSEYIKSNPNAINEIAGANDFIQYLVEQENCKVAIATGGWEETAMFKLHAAGIDISRCSFSSSSEFHSRIEIMKSAESKSVSENPFDSKIYFGDGLWDKDASEFLNYKFILVGSKFKYINQVPDFKNIEMITKIMAL